MILEERIKNEKITFKNSKNYKGSIVFHKEKIGNEYRVIKDSINGSTISIDEKEYNWIRTKEEAEKIWAYYYFGICGGIRHPLYNRTQWEFHLQNENKELKETIQELQTKNKELEAKLKELNNAK